MGLETQRQVYLARLGPCRLPHLESRLDDSLGTIHEIPSAFLSASSTWSMIEADATPILRVMRADSTV